MRVAHSNQKPLLPITCGKISLQVVSNCAKCSKGDIGLTPKEVESKLEAHFQLAQARDCVLLLDEADIFLVQRNNRDLRNALDLVFLSCHIYSTPNISSPYVLLVILGVLEYSEGILFLTTNSVGAVDKTFQSRIHLSLCILRLNEEQTYKVWKSQLRRLTDEPKSVIKLDEFEILNYATKLFTP